MSALAAEEIEGGEFWNIVGICFETASGDKSTSKRAMLWKRSAGLPPLEAIPVDQFTSRLLLHFTSPPRCPPHSLRFPGMQTSPRARVAPTIESGAAIKSP
jgi:hypothetical protein